MTLRNLFAFVFMLLKLGFLRPKFRIPAMILLGVFCGMGLLLAHIARTTTYLIDSPETCMNCHVMTDSYVSHRNSSHGRDVSCNDCHLPHTSFAREYAFKAVDGLKHAYAFTVHTESQTMPLSSFAAPVEQENCMRCHEGRMSEVSASSYQTSERKCWDCHRDVVHGRVRSLSASPSVSRPSLPPVTELPPIPSWSQLFGTGNKHTECPGPNGAGDIRHP
jgi:cytochrome c nitrite reductase small subunit